LISKPVLAAVALAVTAAALAVSAIAPTLAAPPHYRTPPGTRCKVLHATGTALPLDVHGTLKRCSHSSLTGGGGTFSLRGGRSLRLAISWENGTTTSTTLQAHHLRRPCAAGEVFLLESPVLTGPVLTGRPAFVGELVGMTAAGLVCVATNGNDITMTLQRASFAIH
jgi:hypothetical protein